jgi:hypothetical protein
MDGSSSIKRILGFMLFSGLCGVTGRNLVDPASVVDGYIALLSNRITSYRISIVLKAVAIYS